MPLPTLPNKLGDFLSPDQYTAKAPKPARRKNQSKEAGHPARVTELETQGAAARAATPGEATPGVGAALVFTVAEPPPAAPVPRSRKTRQLAALLRTPQRPAAELDASTAAPQARADARLPKPASTPALPGAVQRAHGPRRTVAERTKLFVLDTNVLMHDPSCLFRFEEHDVYLPMMTLEELDNHKKGMSEVARNARQVSRTLDALMAQPGMRMEAGIKLSRLGNREAAGRLFFQTRLAEVEPIEGLPQGKADNQILGVVRALQQMRANRQVVLVSKDINMRIKAHALGLPAEDYFNDQVLEDKDRRPQT